MIIFTDGRTPRTGDQLVTRPLPKHRTTQTQNKRIHTPNIHALCGIRTHDPGFRASKDNSCLRQLGYRDRHSTWPFPLRSSHIVHIFYFRLCLKLITFIRYNFPVSKIFSDKDGFIFIPAYILNNF
jgi:hypothetical protein